MLIRHLFSLTLMWAIAPSLAGLEAHAQDFGINLSAFDIRATVTEVRPDGTRTAADWSKALTPDLELEGVIVKEGQSIGSILAARGIRPDDYTIDMVAQINGISDPNRIAAQTQLSVFNVSGLAVGRGEQIALQPYRAEREQTSEAMGRILIAARDSGSPEIVQTARLLEKLYDRQRIVDRTEVMEQAAEAASLADFLSQTTNWTNPDVHTRLIAFADNSSSRGLAATTMSIKITLNWAKPPAPNKCIVVVAAEELWQLEPRRSSAVLPLGNSIVPVKTKDNLDIWVQRREQPIKRPAENDFIRVSLNEWRAPGHASSPIEPVETCQ